MAALNPVERAFLQKLATTHQGRIAYSQIDYDKARLHLQGLIDLGFIKDRRKGYSLGFQLTSVGREYLDGAA